MMASGDPYYEELLDKACDECWEYQDRLLDEIAREVIKRLAEAEVGLTGIDGSKLMHWLQGRRIQLAVQYGRMTPNRARELMGLRPCL